MYLFISFAIYGLGCVLALTFFLVGRSPALIENHRPWPVVFLWPLLILWPIHAFAGYFIRWQISRPKKTQPFTATGTTGLAPESIR